MRLHTFCLSLALAVVPAFAQTTERLTITPALAAGAQAAPPLALRLSLDDAQLGNAAPLYLSAIAALPDVEADRELGRNVEAVVGRTVGELDADLARRVLTAYEPTLKLVEVAVKRERCDWDLPWRTDGMQVLLDHLSGLREIANALSIRATLAAHDGDWPRFLETVRAQGVLAQHTASHGDAVLVEQLVGVGIRAMNLATIRRSGGGEAMPNLYWALSAMPIDFDFVRAIESEKKLILRNYPDLEDPDAFDVDAFKRVIHTLQGPMALRPQTANGRLAEAAGETWVAMGLLPEARSYLVERGRFTAEEVAAMDIYPTLGHYMAGTWDDIYDVLIRSASLPLPEAEARGDELVEDLARNEWGQLLVSIIMPSIDRGRLSIGELERLRAAQTVVEALRDHAARHGELPASLDGVELYLPPDPLTGDRLAYEGGGESATLTLKPGDDGIVWHLTLSRGE